MLDLGRVQVPELLGARLPTVSIPFWAEMGFGRPEPPNTFASPPPVQKEIRDIERDKASGVTIEVQGNSIQKLIGCIKGGLGGLQRVGRDST